MLHKKTSRRCGWFFCAASCSHPPRFALPPRGRLGATPRPPPWQQFGISRAFFVQQAVLTPPSVAQVGFLGGDLRRKSWFCDLEWCRSPPFFLTCGNIPRHLRQKCQGPAPRNQAGNRSRPNPKITEQVDVALGPLGGTLRCSASQNGRAEHRDLPPECIEWGL